MMEVYTLILQLSSNRSKTKHVKVFELKLNPAASMLQMLFDIEIDAATCARCFGVDV